MSLRVEALGTWSLRPIPFSDQALPRISWCWTRLRAVLSQHLITLYQIDISAALRRSTSAGPTNISLTSTADGTDLRYSATTGNLGISVLSPGLGSSAKNPGSRGSAGGSIFSN